MDASLLATSMVLGFSIAAPVGPIGTLCIRRSLAEGPVVGFATGMGAATADALYAAVSAFGLTLVSALLVGQQLWLRIIGGAFLIYLGVRTFASKPIASASSEAPSKASLFRAYVSTFLLTLTNPLTIMSFAVIFAGLGLASGGSDPASAFAVVLGVFLGSALWWLILASGAGLLRSRLSVRGLRWVNAFSGIIIASFGVVALGSLLA